MYFYREFVFTIFPVIANSLRVLSKSENHKKIFMFDINKQHAERMFAVLKIYKETLIYCRLITTLHIMRRIYIMALLTLQTTDSVSTE